MPATGDPVVLHGLAIDPLTQQQVLDRVFSGWASGRGGWVVTPNLEILRQYVADPALDDVFRQADVVVADGAPLIWASRLQGTPLPERVAGSDLVWALPGRASQAGASVFLLGGNPGVADVAANRLRERFPALRVAGTYCPPFGYEDDPVELERIDQAVRDAAPDMVLVCLGFPRQERLIARLRAQSPGAWFFGLGVSLSFVAGDVRRAPVWMQRLGVEWLHRLVQEPDRLFDRYVRHGIPFALRLLTGALRRRLVPTG